MNTTEKRQSEYALCQDLSQVLNVMSGLPRTEAQRIAADLVANAAKADWHRRNDMAAFCCQIATQSKGEQA